MDTASDSDKVAHIEGQIHDKWFRLSMVYFNPKDHEWCLYLGNSQKGPFDQILKIEGILDYSYTDEPKIDVYDINQIKIDASCGTLILTSGFPLEIKLSISPAFKISLC
ncbi:MAG: hypothetical protein WC975_16045 [Phycisphaerae bacterium]